MGLSLASNTDSIRAQTSLAKTTRQLSKTFERLSSGLRINTAADDPAGLIIANRLAADARLASVAVRNANDAISYLQTADSGLDSISSLLTRMAELANQSINGSYTQTQRSAISSEYQALGSEIERIARTSTFNNMTLLSNSSGLTVQVGIDGTANSNFSVNAVLGTLSSLGIGNAGGSLTYSVLAGTDAASQSAAQLALDAVNAAIGSVSMRRGTLGASQSRLEVAVDYLAVARENYLASESRIRDADIAEEIAEMTRLQILQQAGIAILAQANQQPAAALELLK